MIETIEKLLDILCYHIEDWNVSVDKYIYSEDNRYIIEFKVNDKLYNINFINDLIELNTWKQDMSKIGSIYKIKIPIEKEQLITMRIEVLLNFCLKYTKDAYNLLVSAYNRETTVTLYETNF